MPNKWANWEHDFFFKKRHSGSVILTSNIWGMLCMHPVRHTCWSPKVCHQRGSELDVSVIKQWRMCSLRWPVDSHGGAEEGDQWGPIFLFCFPILQISSLILSFMFSALNIYVINLTLLSYLANVSGFVGVCGVMQAPNLSIPSSGLTTMLWKWKLVNDIVKQLKI